MHVVANGAVRAWVFHRLVLDGKVRFEIKELHGKVVGAQVADWGYFKIGKRKNRPYKMELRRAENKVKVSDRFCEWTSTSWNDTVPSYWMTPSPCVGRKCCGATTRTVHVRVKGMGLCGQPPGTEVANRSASRQRSVSLANYFFDHQLCVAALVGPFRRIGGRNVSAEFATAELRPPVNPNGKDDSRG